MLVYYRGSNDAWDGYGGAVLYSRSKTVPQRAVPEIRAALSKVGLKWESFTATDNSCKPRESRLEEVEADLILVETKVGGGLRVASRAYTRHAPRWRPLLPRLRLEGLTHGSGITCSHRKVGYVLTCA